METEIWYEIIVYICIYISPNSPWGWPHHLHVPNDMEIWEYKTPGTFWATPKLLGDFFTFYLLY